MEEDDIEYDEVQEDDLEDDDVEEDEDEDQDGDVEEDEDEDDNVEDEVEKDKVEGDDVEKEEDNDAEEDEEKDENVVEDEVEEEDVEHDDVEEEDWSQDLRPHFVRACAVEMHFNMSQELLYTEIERKNAAAQSEHPDHAPAFTLTVTTPQCGHTVWGNTRSKQCRISSENAKAKPRKGNKEKNNANGGKSPTCLSIYTLKRWLTTGCRIFGYAIFGQPCIVVLGYMYMFFILHEIPWNPCCWWLPSGKRLHNYGKIHPFFMGKSTINHHFQ